MLRSPSLTCFHWCAAAERYPYIMVYMQATVGYRYGAMQQGTSTPDISLQVTIPYTHAYTPCAHPVHLLYTCCTPRIHPTTHHISLHYMDCSPAYHAHSISTSWCIPAQYITCARLVYTLFSTMYYLLYRGV